MKTKEINSTGNINCIIVCTADKKKPKNKKNPQACVHENLQFIPKSFLSSIATKFQQDVVNR